MRRRSTGSVLFTFRFDVEWLAKSRLGSLVPPLPLLRIVPQRQAHVLHVADERDEDEDKGEGEGDEESLPRPDVFVRALSLTPSAVPLAMKLLVEAWRDA